MGSGTMVGSFDGWLGASPGSGAGGGGGGGTLASIYAFGLAAPNTDNIFAQPAGKRLFTSIVSNSPSNKDAPEEWYADRTAIDLAVPPAANLRVNVANLSGVGGNGCGTFDVNGLSDPSWNGTFNAISNMAWLVEEVMFSAVNTKLPPFTGTVYARREWLPNGASPYIPGAGQTNSAMVHQIELYDNFTAAVSQTSRLDGFGMTEQRLRAIQNGANAQWVTHWLNSAGVPAAGDGPTWWIDKDSRFAHFDPAAGLQAYQEGADQVASAWGWRMWAYDGAGHLNVVLDVDNTRGLLNSIPFPTTCSFISDEFDMTVPGVYGFSSMPSLPGYTLSQVSARIVFDNLAATTFATGPTLSVGNNVTHDNILTSAVQPTAATINIYVALGPGGTYPGGNLATQSTGKFPDLTTVPSVSVTVGATGTAITQAKARIILTGLLSKVLPFH